MRLLALCLTLRLLVGCVAAGTKVDQEKLLQFEQGN
jgi:hypothetical protein